MKRLPKKYQESLKLIDKTKKYTVSEACELVKKTAKSTKWDETIDVSFKLNIDAKQADQQLRGTIVLPHGNGKTKKLLAVTDKVEEAKAAGADFVGGKEMLEKIEKENWFEFDVIVATPNMMPSFEKIGKVLGPRGLMPNPKSGTVAVDIASAIKEIKNGKITYRNDKDGNIAVSFGKASFDAQKLADNLNAIIDVIVKARPSAVKGTYILNCTISSTFGPSIRIAI